MSGVNLSKALDHVMLVFNTLPSLVGLSLNYCGIKNIHSPRGPLNSTFLTSVQFLGLKGNGLTGSILNALQNMTSLRELDLSYQWITPYFGDAAIDNLQGISMLSSLQHLDMSGVNLSKALDLMQVLNTLPSLVGLRLQDCGIKNIHFPRGSLNSTFLTSVQFVDLSGNGLTGSIPNAVQNMTSLRELDLSNQMISFSVEAAFDNLQWVSRLSSLQHLDMSGVNLSKALDVMLVLNMLPSLVGLRLNDCGIKNIHFPRGSLNSTFLTSVQFLDLYGNGLTGSIPNALQNMTSLRELHLNYQWTPHYGEAAIDNLQGISRLSSLQHLDMSGVNLSKALDLMQVLNTLPSLTELHLYGCGIQNIHFTCGSLNSTFLESVQFLGLGNNGLKGPIPDALQNMIAVRSLDLSSNYFNSTIPLWIVNSKSLVDLNLGFNEFKNIEDVKKEQELIKMPHVQFRVSEFNRQWN
uniref:Uncharacterized protein n=1 Tax=Ficus carica TaxID=3494 RepID=A0AA88JHP3_FICCA|nr:hypothetical protein TIFTF001_055284 [Ficus carica]GMN72855.1 hypothetical protein TIFTF001_055286 [Ficus carica]